MPRKHSITFNKQQNTQKLCSSKACSKPRVSLSGYCGPHAGKRYKFGHCEGRRIRHTEYKNEKSQVVQFLEDHKDHVAITTAIGMLDTWLKEASLGLGAGAKADLNRLYKAGVTGREVLIEVLSVWLYSTHNPYKLPNDLRLTYALGLATLYLTPRSKMQTWSNGKEKVYYKRITGAARRLVGEQLKAMLLPLFLNFQVAFERTEAEDETVRQAIMVKF